MIQASTPDNEEKRIQVLNNYNILDTLPEKDFDAITQIASGICNTPIALISLVDKNRQWFKSNHGLSVSQTDRKHAFCAHSILTPDKLFVVNDATKDERFFDNPLTTEKPNIVFYAGAPLNTSEGVSLGALCVIDDKPKTLSQSQQNSLILLAEQVVSLLELRKRNSELIKVNNKVTQLNEQLNNFAYRLTHDLKSPLSGVNFLLDVIKKDHINLFKDTEAEQYVDLISNRMLYMKTLIDDILEYTKVNTENIVYEEFNLKTILESIIENIDFEDRISINAKKLDINITSSKIGFVQIFQNLISNSRKFCDEDKVKIEVDFEEDTNYYYFIFRDNGPGIVEKYRDKVFKMFETLESTSDNKDNTGIGLATVKSIIKRLKGGINLKNREDGAKGVCFNFSVLKKNI